MANLKPACEWFRLLEMINYSILYMQFVCAVVWGNVLRFEFHFLLNNSGGCRVQLFLLQKGAKRGQELLVIRSLIEFSGKTIFVFLIFSQ